MPLYLQIASKLLQDRGQEFEQLDVSDVLDEG